MTAERSMSTGTKLMIDFGPLLIFFLANSFGGVFVATAAFMLATAAAMLVSKIKTGGISPMLWFTGLVVAVFGGLTLYLHDETFIKLKPTIIYSMFAAILIFGMVTGRPVLKLVLESAYPSLQDEGWRKLTRNWAIFFVCMAVLNEIVWRSVSTDTWVQFKVWGVTIISLIFAMAQAPILMRHGTQDPEPPVPPQG